MLTKHVVSVNILRDIDKEIKYIPTPNARQVADQISNDFKRGMRAFNIIGSYGTGKSAFLLAYQKSLNEGKGYFDINISPGATFKFINFIGEFKSVEKVFADYFNVKEDGYTAQNIFSAIFNDYYDLVKKNQKSILFIIIDEIGKYLEYAFKNAPEKELYFLQQLSEFVADTDNNIVLITAAHQNFDAYASALSTLNKQEWNKVRGRFRELAFNEPVEQLLFLASEQIDENFQVNDDEEKLKASLEIFRSARAFRFKEDQIYVIAGKLHPLEILSAYILTFALQRYGQNERSLFSFLNSTDHTGLEHHIETANSLYGLDKVYDYLTFNFYSTLQTIENPNLGVWQAIKTTIESVENIFNENIHAYTKIVKSIGLLFLFAEGGAKLDKNFLIQYATVNLGLENAEGLIGDLENKNLIRYRNYSKRYVFPEGTDLDIPSELLKASNKVEQISDVTTLLNKYYQLPPVIAKEATYKTGTPRIFEYIISDYPKTIIPEGETDGFINLIFNENISLDSLLEYSAQQEQAFVYGYYKNATSISDLLFEIEKTKKVIEENIDDKVAVKELNNIKAHQQNLLNHKILNNFYSTGKEIIWIYKGQKIAVNSKKEFNNLISNICFDIYNKAPRFNNELINKHKLSASIHGSKKLYLKALVNHWNLPGMGFSETRFPAEKTIATALLIDNGIKLYEDFDGQVTVSEKNNFHLLWDLSLDFLKSAKVSRRNLSEFAELLSKKPFKLKQGLIDFWVPTFLFIKRNDFALFHEDRYIPYLNGDVLELLIKNPEEYDVKTFDVEGVKLNIFNSYRLFLEQSEQLAPGNDTFIETIKPFLVFYRGLPQYTKSTKRLSAEALRVRDVIVYFGETDHVIPWQTDHLNCWRTSAADAIGTMSKVMI